MRTLVGGPLSGTVVPVETQLKLLAFRIQGDAVAYYARTTILAHKPTMETPTVTHYVFAFLTEEPEKVKDE